MTEDLDAAGLALQIDTARQRMITFVQRCTDADWHAAPVPGDPRPVGVIADHVAHAYEYLAGWIGDLIAGKPVEVNTAIVDELNAEHAGDASSVTAAHVAGHLRSSGDALIKLVAGLEPAQLEMADGRVHRFAVIAIRHPDNHLSELEEALSAAA